MQKELKNEIQRNRRKYYEDHPKICRKCGQEEGEINLHHIRPLSRGGDNSIDNLIPLCYSCHKDFHRYYDEIFENSDDYKINFQKFVDAPTRVEKEVFSELLFKFRAEIENKKLTADEIIRTTYFLFDARRSIRDGLINEFYSEKLSCQD